MRSNYPESNFFGCSLSNALFVSCAFLVCLLALVRHGVTLEAFDFVISSWAFIVFLIYDLRGFVVPKGLAIFCLILGPAIGRFLSVEFFLERLFGALFGFIFLWALLIVSTWILRAGSKLKMNEFSMGPGDPLLFAVIGGFLGYSAFPILLLLASVQGLLIHLLSKLLGEVALGNKKRPIVFQVAPFGAFLCLAALQMLAFAN